MGSSDTGGGSVEGVIEASVGSIVWVRRRNGSWWPGKVVGPDEFTSPHLTSPRSGTPVKLLGREDASVDWYNLEKSKRVKSFRCGEFDNCIERAEAVSGMPPKKREKYARREDAILHALELEKQLLEKKYGKSGFSFNDRCKKLSDAATSSEYLENGSGMETSPASNLISEERDTSAANKIVMGKLNEDPLGEGNQLSGDDNNACTLPRMRGLQEIGLHTTPIKEDLPGITFRAKKSRYDHLSDSGTFLNNSGIQPSELEIPVSKFEDSDSLYTTDLGEAVISESTEDTETDCSETDSLETDSDEDITALSDDSASIELHPKYPARTESQEEHISISSNDFDGLMFADESPLPISNDLASTGPRESKWPLKRKRNNRLLGKRSLDRINLDASRSYVRGRNSNWKSRGFKADLTKRGFRTHSKDSGHNIVDFESLTLYNSSDIRGYLEHSQEFIDRLYVGTHNFGGRIILVDVDLKVQASNYPRDVPMVSLISKLNGHAIVGHPIQIEALENGSSDNLLAGAQYLFTESMEGPSVLPRVWRTGRRTTNFRVPRPNMSSALDGDNRQKSLILDNDRKLSFGSEPGSINQKLNVTRNMCSQYRVDGKYARNSIKKVSLSPNQKIRTLSSIESEQKHHNNATREGINKLDGSLIKDKYLPTTVACIPVNLVFSRLHEELNGRHQL